MKKRIHFIQLRVFFYLTLKSHSAPLAGVAQWIERWPENQRVPGFIPGQSTYLACGPGPHWDVCERQPHVDVSLPLFVLPSPLSKNK